MNLTDLLTQLATAVPNICEPIDGMPTLFGVKIRDDKNNLVYRRLIYSDLPEPLSLTALGDLAWLDMAIRREIEQRGWAWELFSSGDGLIWVDDTTYESEVGLFAAFLAAVEEEGR